MKNLKSPEKKLIFKIVWHFVVFVIIGMTVVMFLNVIDSNKESHNKAQMELVKFYEGRIYEKDSTYKELEKNNRLLVKEIDSLELQKNKVIIKYDEKIKSINDASARQHAIWMDAVLSKLDNFKK